MRRSALILTISAAGLAVTAAVASSAPTRHHAVSGNISMVGVWSGAEAKNFNMVLSAFEKLNPGVHVKYTSAGDNTPTVLSTAVQGGNPPDLAAISQPGVVKDFASRGALKPIGFARATIAKYYAPSWITLGTINKKLYGMVFKGANKSTVWYNVSAFKNAGITPPKTWTALLKDAGTLKASGVPPFAIAGGDGWPLTDIQENIYLRQAGPVKYDLLAAHKIKWTDPTVIASLKTMAQVFASDDMYGGTSGALTTDFPTSVNDVFVNPPKAAMTMEGDFVPGVATTKLEADHRLQPVPVPVGQRLAAVGRRRWRHRRDVQGQPGGSCADLVPRDARGGHDLGEAGRVLVAEQGCQGLARIRIRSTARPPWRSRTRRSSASISPTCRPARSAARPARESGRSSRTS